MNNEEYREKIEKAQKRAEERAITLRELLIAMSPESPLPSEWQCWDDIRPGSVFRIMLCFMSEEETWIECYRNHPILIPWYDCKVIGFNAAENNTLNVWLKYNDFLRQRTGNSEDRWW